MNSNVKAAMEAIARYEQERGNGNQDSAHVKATHLNCALIALDHLDLLHANVPKEAASGMTTCDLNGWLESIGVGDSAVIYDYIVAKHWVTTRITARKFVKAHPDGDYLIVTKGHVFAVKDGQPFNASIWTLNQYVRVAWKIELDEESESDAERQWPSSGAEQP